MNSAPYQALSYVYQPAAETATHTLLLLHGTGGDERDLLPLATRFGAGVNVLSLRGNAPEDGIPRFFRRLKMGVFDEDDVIFRTHELVHFLRETGRNEGFDFTQLVAMGYSNGANIAGAILMLYPELLTGAVLWRPMQPLIRAVPPFATTRHQPILFCPGTHDPTVLSAASTQYATLLAAAGFDLTRWDIEAGHQLTHADVETAVNWFQQHFVEDNEAG